MSGLRIQFGDRVRHVKRPEWGVGAVVRVEDIANNGKTTQRLSVRFPNAGLKTLNTDVAALEVISDDADTADSIDDLDRMGRSEWLAPIAQKKIEELMISIPQETRDVFTSLRSRLTMTLDLYRFDKSGKGLIDWAYAQSRLDDPLSRFNRHELEVLFDRWSHERDQHLSRLLQDAKKTPDLVRKLRADAPPAAQKALERLAALR